MTDQIRPIGPRERDIEPIYHAHRVSPDGGRGGSDPQEPPPRRQAPRHAPEPVVEVVETGDAEGGGPHIDVRV